MRQFPKRGLDMKGCLTVWPAAICNGKESEIGQDKQHHGGIRRAALIQIETKYQAK